MSLGTGYSDGFGGNGVSLAEAQDLSNGSYDYAGTPGGIVNWQNDAQEQGRLGAFYPNTSTTPWWDSAATVGVTRAIDSLARSYATVKGAQAATYAGQNGLTFTNGRQMLGVGGNMLPLLLIGGALLLLMK
ncbi:hypothetical protein [Variovorax sp. SRS16]|uniref:hypothetical protein n=1 Tax=Variovorax sp. SRS16 TaxID=282217 RepID=UPI0013A56644|nr:hypothetical protein [Variovorax sp. SRS16]